MTTKDTAPRYYEAVGRRKTAVARVRFEESSKASFIVNDKEVASYFPTDELRAAVISPLSTVNVATKFKITAKVSGGGIAAQAIAIRHGLSRGLLELDQTLRKSLKSAGYLKRDPRMKERRKFGLRKARKAKQWSKR